MVAKRPVGRGNRGKPVGVNPLRESHEWGSYIVKKGKVAGGVVVVVVLFSHRVRGCDATGPVKRANEMELKFKGEKAVVGTATDGRKLLVGVRGFPVMEVSLDDPRISPEVIAAAAINGFRQRLMDAAALKRNTTTGQSQSPAEKDAAIRKLYDHYLSGTTEWELQRGAAGPRMDPLVVRAIMEAFGKTEDEVRSMIEKKAAEQSLKPAEYCAALAEHKKVKPVVERLRTESLAAIKVDDEPFADEDGADEDAV